MRELCLSKAKEENFLQFVDLRNRNEESLESSVSANVRRVVFYLDGNRVDDSHHFINTSNCSLRCLVVELGSVFSNLKLVSECNRFLRLRVLKLERPISESEEILRIVKLPKKIGNLVHLRLLSFCNIVVEKIPSSIGNLKCLQTLELDCGIYNDKLPNRMWKLEQLRHLCLPRYVSSQFLSLCKLRNLQTLAWVRSECLERNDLLELKNLRKLKMDYADRNLERIFCDPTTVTFDRLRHLQVYSKGQDKMMAIDIVPMILSFPQIYKLRLWLRIVKLPEDSQFSPNLLKLQLNDIGLKDDPMPTLEKLPNLRVLGISWSSYEGNEMVCSKGDFPRLESLQIRYLENLEEWKVEEGALSSLLFLGIDYCLRLRRVPDGLRYITKLKEMKIEDMPKEFKKRLEEGGEDFYKVHHVPSLVILNCDRDDREDDERSSSPQPTNEKKLQLIKALFCCSIRSVDTLDL